MVRPRILAQGITCADYLHPIAERDLSQCQTGRAKVFRLSTFGLHKNIRDYIFRCADMAISRQAKNLCMCTCNLPLTQTVLRFSKLRALENC